MLKVLLGAVLSFCVMACAGVGAQSPASAAADPFASLHFLEGSWTAHGTGQGAGQGATSDGTYSFRRELNGHVLARHARLASCKAPSDFDCEHGDLLYVFADAPGQPLKAIYFDSEGHVLHYNVSTPDPTTVVFLSENAGGGPQFRLMYSFRAGVMTGSFAMQLPGSAEWHPYLTWTGAQTGK